MNKWFRRGLAFFSVVVALLAMSGEARVHAQLCCNPPAFSFAYVDVAPSSGNSGYYITSCSPRLSPIDFTKRTLALIVGGQSNEASYGGDLYVPANTANIDMIDVQNGGQYAICGPMLGASFNPGSPGAIPAHLADLLITNNKFDRIFVLNESVTNTLIADWDSTLYTKICASIQRLKQYGVTPTAPNVTFAIQFGIGESDNTAATSQAAQQTSYASLVSKIQACGFPTTSRFFLRTESYVTGAVASAVTGAQAFTIAHSTGVFQSGNTDTVGAADRCGDNIHMSDFTGPECISHGGSGASAGATAAALLDYNAMHASGAPF